MNALDDFDNAGYALLPQFIAPEKIHSLLVSLAGIEMEARRGGVRNIDRRVPEIAAFSKDPLLLSLAQRHLTGFPRLLRVIYFDKSADNNWLVSWHQDKSVAVEERFDAPGWGPWSTKDQVLHVHAPIEFLQNMLTIRVHLDDATLANGCLKLIPGSHKPGLLNDSEVTTRVAEKDIVCCELPAGGALAMRPHLLHASEKSTLPSSRRVLHFEYAGTELPGPDKQ